MRLLDTNTRYFDQDTFQIPRLNNSWGCMIDMLDVALVFGNAYQNVLKITAESDPLYPDLYWLFTISVNEGHGLKENLSVVQIENSNIEIYNGIFRVQSVTKTSFSIAIHKSESLVQPLDLVFVDGVQFKTPPLGFEKYLEGSQKAVYKLTTREDTTCYLRVDNSCPPGHNIAAMKFSRVSMLSDIDSIDDYSFRLGRKKAPASASSYNAVEEGITDVWINSRLGDQHYVDVNRAPNLPPGLFSIIGDSETFYLRQEALKVQTEVNREDVVYVFGKYFKYAYTEDPHPFLMTTSTRENPTSPYYLNYNILENFIRDTSKSKHTFNSEEMDIYTIPDSNTWAPWLSDAFLSGTNTRLSFVPYKNELNLNLFDCNLRLFRKNNTVLEGRLRGVTYIMNNLQNNPALAPQINQSFRSHGKYYVRFESNDYSNQISYAVQLNDWD